MKKPDTIPMPGPDEIITGLYQAGGKCCLSRWVNIAFPLFKFDNARVKFRELLRKEITKLVGHDEPIVWFNDRLSTAEQRAKVWKRAAKKMGYVVEDKPWRAK